MWSFKPLIVLMIVATLSGCGFRPLYGKHSTALVSQELSLVYIETIADRRGQMLRNRLLTLMSPQGKAANPRYSLTTTLSESIVEQLKREDEKTTNADLRLRASFVLRDLRSGVVLLEGRSLATSSYDVVDSESYRLASERDARKKSVRLLADSIKARISAYLLNPSKPRPKPEIDKRI